MAFSAQQAMPVVKECAKKMTPTAKEVAKEITKGVKEGIKEEDQIKCKHCGEMTDKDSTYCESCGKKM